MAERERQTGRPTGESGVQIEICVECGREYTFEDEAVPEDLACEKCGGKVFRSYFESFEPSEASIDFEETTGRDMHPDDPEGETTSGDLVDLERL